MCVLDGMIRLLLPPSPSPFQNSSRSKTSGSEINLWFMMLQHLKWFKLLKLFTSDPNQNSRIKIFAHSKAFFMGKLESVRKVLTIRCIKVFSFSVQSIMRFDIQKQSETLSKENLIYNTLRWIYYAYLRNTHGCCGGCFKRHFRKCLL